VAAAALVVRAIENADAAAKQLEQLAVERLDQRC
jgi:hypothetical protein